MFHDEIAVPRPSGGGEDPRGRYTIDTTRLNSRPDLVENRLRLLCRYRTTLQARRLAEELVRRGLEPVRGRGLLEAAEAAIREMESPSGEYSAMLRQGHPESLSTKTGDSVPDARRHRPRGSPHQAGKKIRASSHEAARIVGLSLLSLRIELML